MKFKSFLPFFLKILILSIFVSQRVPKLQAEDQAVWWDTLNKMQKILRKAAASLNAASKLEKDMMHNYFMSGKTKNTADGNLC